MLEAVYTEVDTLVVKASTAIIVILNGDGKGYVGISELRDSSGYLVAEMFHPSQSYSNYSVITFGGEVPSPLLGACQ